MVFGLDVRTPAEPTAGVTHFPCDLSSANDVQRVIDETQPECIAHLAAVTHIQGKSLADYAANIAGVEHLVQAVLRNGRVQRVVCTSTQLVCRVGYQPRSDEDYGPSTVYGESKVRTEQIWRRADGAGTTWCLVRPTTIWGPGMNPHYMHFFNMLRRGRYVHVGRAPVRKTYGFVGNTTHQYLRLIEAPAPAIHRRIFYLGDYEPIDLRQWAEAFRRALDAPAIRTVPIGIARTVAYVGDALNAVGFERFVLNSFRLRNVLTSSEIDLSATRSVCGPLPYTEHEGIEQTADWLRRVWSGSAGVPRIQQPQRVVSEA